MRLYYYGIGFTQRTWWRPWTNLAEGQHTLQPKAEGHVQTLPDYSIDYCGFILLHFFLLWMSIWIVARFAVSGSLLRDVRN